jgi:3-keto-5-aminohexanoate cleavage enzyme
VLATNTELVERVVRIGRELGREAASPEEAGQIIGLPGFQAAVSSTLRRKRRVVPFRMPVKAAA